MVTTISVDINKQRGGWEADRAQQMEFLQFHDRATHRLAYIVKRSSQLLESACTHNAKDVQVDATLHPDPVHADEVCIQWMWSSLCLAPAHLLPALSSSFRGTRRTVKTPRTWTWLTRCHPRSYPCDARQVCCSQCRWIGAYLRSLPPVRLTSRGCVTHSSGRGSWCRHIFPSQQYAPGQVCGFCYRRSVLCIESV